MIAASTIWIPVHLVIIVGLILMLGGLVAIYYATPAGPARALARLGYVAAIAGITAGLVLIALDGIAAKHLAEAWAAAAPNDRSVALGLVVAQENISLALVALFNILFAGAAYILFGLAAVRARTYPPVLGWIVACAGAGSAVVGMTQAYLGESTGPIQILTIIFPTVITAWTALMGVLLLKGPRARKPYIAGPAEHTAMKAV